MEKHTVIVLCAVTSCACAGASSIMGMEMVWLHAAFRLLAQMELELVAVGGCSQLMWNQLTLSFPPKVFQSQLKERTDSTVSSPLWQDQTGQGIRANYHDNYQFGSAGVVFSQQWGTWVLQFMQACCSAGCVWWVDWCFGVWSWVNAQVMWGKKGMGGKWLGVWFYRALFLFNEGG